jgi:organic radical activating enzyme
MINWKCNSCDGIYESLDIRFTKACDNNCSFCIEKFGIKSLGKTDVAALAKSVFDSDFKNILIVGGEPLLDLQKLYQFVHLVRSYTKVKKIYVTTSLPISIDINLDTKSLLIDIIKLIDGLKCITSNIMISRINNVVLHASSKHDRLETLFMLTHINPEISE